MSKPELTARDWPEPNRYRRSIRLEFALYVSGLILVIMVATGYVITDKYSDTVTQNVIDNLLSQARAYSGPAGKLIISTGEPDALMLNNICKKLADNNPELYWAGITDNRGLFLAHTDLKQVIAETHIPGLQHQASEVALRDGESLSLANDTIKIVVPIMDRDIQLGMLGVASSVREIASARSTSIVTVATITLLMIIIGLPLVVIVLHRKLRPIRLITDSLKQVDVEDLILDIPVSSKNEFGYLSETLRVLGSRLNLAQRELVEKQRIERELEIATEIQANMLPRQYPIAENYQFSGTYRSAREVGGDYYDFIDIDDNHIAVLVADVSGKSLPGMLVMLLTRNIVTRLARSIRQPARLLCETNRELLGSIGKGMFVTMFYGVLNKTSGEFTFASAGHNPWIRLNSRTASFEKIKTNGYPLGFMAPAKFDQRLETGRHTFSGEEWMILYTDGINEAQNTDREEFGMDRFMQTLKSSLGNDPEQMVQSTLQRLDEFVETAPQYDDITLVAMKWSGERANRPDVSEGVVANAR